jgi:hypothetical protein
VKRFWDQVIEKIFIQENVRKIVEIGALRGENTVKILKYCSAYNAKLIIIEPFPQFDVEKLNEEFPGYFRLYEDISHHVLPNITGYDAVLIDGDHNWYTVYHELKMIEKKAKKRGKFPIVFLHDIGWPYGRRDMYHDPDLIPQKYRKPYTKKGIAPGHSELIDPLNYEKDIKCMNAHMNNALYDFGEKNGVLTAVEDFMKETKIPLSFYGVSKNHGLGILTSKKLDVDNKIKSIFKF